VSLYIAALESVASTEEMMPQVSNQWSMALNLLERSVKVEQSVTATGGMVLAVTQVGSIWIRSTLVQYGNQ